MGLEVGKLVIGGKLYNVDAPVIAPMTSGWDHTIERCIEMPTHAACGGFATNPTNRRYALRYALRSYGRTPPLEGVQAVVNLLIVHHDGVGSSAMAFDVLHNERKLSTHFYIDNDGAIYQGLDLALAGFHAAEYNPRSIGVHLSNRGDAKKEPDYYSQRGQTRDVKECVISGHEIRAFDFTRAQYESFTQLFRALLRLFPELPPTFPQTSTGQQRWNVLPDGEAMRFRGIVGHYHLTAQKWDPGPFDFAVACRKSSGYPAFPLAAEPGAEPVVVPERLDADAAMLFARTDRPTAGKFPLGPWGDARLWHGGIHVLGAEGERIYAPFAGTVVAARNGYGSGPIGSTNFVLLRHDVVVGPERLRFFLLAMHLADLMDNGEPEWVKRARTRPGRTQVLDTVFVEAGEWIGQMGTAGPAGMSSAQVHLEVFSPVELFTDVPGTPWRTVDGSAGGRFCLAKDLDGKPAAELRHIVPYHVSEWCPEPSWARSLRGAVDIPDAEVERLVAEQITPGLWWTDELAAHCGLPNDGMVYHYHPIAFIHWLHQLNAIDPEPVPRPDPSSPIGLTDDTSDDDRTAIDEGACPIPVTLEQLVAGEPPPCRPE